jgi:hypothetical protein
MPVTLEQKKEYHRQYRIDNKEALCQYNREYNEANKELIKQWRMIQIECECCGRNVSQGLIAQHNKSDYHTLHVIAMLKNKLFG